MKISAFVDVSFSDYAYQLHACITPTIGFMLLGGRSEPDQPSMFCEKV